MDKSKMYSLKSATIQNINTDLVFPCYCCQNNKNGDMRENSPTCWTNCQYDRGPEGKSNFRPFFTLDGTAWTELEGHPPVVSDEEIKTEYGCRKKVHILSEEEQEVVRKGIQSLRNNHEAIFARLSLDLISAWEKDYFALPTREKASLQIIIQDALKMSYRFGADSVPIPDGNIKPECEGWTNINGHCRPNKIFIRFLSTPFWYFDRKSETDDEYILNPSQNSEYIPSSSSRETAE